MINFGVQVSPESTLFVSLTGMPQDKVYFSKARDPKIKDSKSETLPVDWSKRASFSKKDFRLIGVNVGLEKTHDEKGKEVNDKQNLVPFDACEYINDHLEDGMSVFVKGNLEYSTFTGQDGNVSHSVKLVPSQISLCKEINFEEQGYEFVHDFSQNLIVQNIKKEEDKYYLEGTVVNYNSLENSDFEVKTEPLAKNLKKLKPYTAISVSGKITTLKNIDKVETSSDDGWGDPNPMNRVNSSYKKILLITGADKETIDTETYSEELVEEALQKVKSNSKAEKEFGDSEDWGDTKGLKDTTEENDEAAW
jgi:single-stranded DNA-binding protein